MTELEVGEAREIGEEPKSRIMGMKEEMKPLLVSYKITMVILEIQSFIGIIKELREKDTSFRFGKVIPYSPTFKLLLVHFKIKHTILFTAKLIAFQYCRLLA